MTDQSKLIQFFESELNDFKSNFLFKDKKLLNEGKFEEFAQAILKRSKKSFGVMFAVALCFVSIGVLYQSNLLVPESPLWIGLSYIFLGISFMVISTREYYKIKGSMTLLLILLGDKTNEQKPEKEAELSPLVN